MMATWRLWTSRDRRELDDADCELAPRLRALPITRYDRVAGGKVPRNHEARAYRLSVGPHVLSATVLQYRRQRGMLELREVLHPAAAPTEAASVVAEVVRFALTDAYRCSGSCALYVEDPDAERWTGFSAILRDVATRAGVALARPPALDADEGSRLFLALSGLSCEAISVVERLDQSGRVRGDTVAFLVQSGVWAAGEADAILLACPYPELVFGGGALPGDRHLARLTLDHARAALLAGALERVLVAGTRTAGAEGRPLVDEPRGLVARQRIGTLLRTYAPEAGLEGLHGWTRGVASELLARAREVHAVVLPRHRSEIEHFWAVDLAAASDLRAAEPAGDDVATMLLLPSDLDQLPDGVRRALIASAYERGLGVLAAPASLPQLTLEASQRLAFARTVRR